MRTVASDRICNCHQLAVVAVVVAVVLYFIPICCICRNLRTFLGGPNGPKICVRGTKFDFEDWGGGGGGAVLYPVLDNFKTILGQFRISLEQIRDNFKTSLGRWRWRWCCTLSRPRLAPGAVRAAGAGGRHFWAAVLWLVAAWTHPRPDVRCRGTLPQGANNGRFMADIIPRCSLCSTIPDLRPVPLWGSSSVQK